MEVRRNHIKLMFALLIFSPTVSSVHSPRRQSGVSQNQRSFRLLSGGEGLHHVISRMAFLSINKIKYGPLSNHLWPGQLWAPVELWSSAPPPTDLRGPSALPILLDDQVHPPPSHFYLTETGLFFFQTVLDVARSSLIWFIQAHGLSTFSVS